MRHCLITCDSPDLPQNAFNKSFGRFRPATLEGGKGGGAPAAPDPWTVANATTSTNQQTAAYNKALNLNNYSNPFGSQSSAISGYDPTTGAPIYQTNITANPQLQSSLSSLLGQTGQSAGINQTALNGIFGAAGNVGNTANSLTNIAGQYQGINAGLSGLQGQLSGLQGQINQGAVTNAQQQGQNAAYAAQTQYLDPQFSQGQESLEAKLANQGLSPGSQAYNNALLNFNNQKQQAYSNAANQSILTGSQIGTQNLQNQLAGINTQAGLLGQQGQMYGQQGSNLWQSGMDYSNAAGAYGQQGGLFGQAAGIGQLPYSNLQSIASMIPGYSGTGQAGAAPADIGSYMNNAYQGQLANYNAQQQSRNQTMSGLFGLGSAAALFALSDRRLKRAIKRIGTWANGLGVYTYRYAWEASGRHIGFMADEVRRIAPHAVIRARDGFDRVIYQLAGGINA